MEANCVHKDLFTKLPHIYLIMPFYSYAYDSVKLLRSLCHDSRDLWLNNQDVIIRMFTKQIIYMHGQRIDENTIKVLKRGNKYRLFKLEIDIDFNDIERTEIFYKMLDEMPNIEFYELFVRSRCDEDLINLLLKKSIHKTRDELFKVLQSYMRTVCNQAEVHEYETGLVYPHEVDIN